MHICHINNLFYMGSSDVAVLPTYLRFFTCRSKTPPVQLEIKYFVTAIILLISIIRNLHRPLKSVHYCGGI